MIAARNLNDADEILFKIGAIVAIGGVVLAATGAIDWFLFTFLLRSAVQT
jgi:hypothetical protein